MKTTEIKLVKGVGLDNNNEQFLLEIKGLKTHFFTETG